MGGVKKSKKILCKASFIKNQSKTQENVKHDEKRNKRGNSLSGRLHQAYLGQINYSNSISEGLEKLIDWLILIFKGI